MGWLGHQMSSEDEILVDSDSEESNPEGELKGKKFQHTDFLQLHDALKQLENVESFSRDSFMNVWNSIGRVKTSRKTTGSGFICQRPPFIVHEEGEDTKKELCSFSDYGKCPFLFVTNAHVVRETDDLTKTTILFFDDKDDTPVVCKVHKRIAFSPRKPGESQGNFDFNILEFALPSEEIHMERILNLTPLKWEFSQKHFDGISSQELVMIGHPRGGYKTIASGSFVDKKHSNDSVRFYDIPSRPGCSGSPVCGLSSVVSDSNIFKVLLLHYDDRKGVKFSDSIASQLQSQYEGKTYLVMCNPQTRKSCIDGFLKQMV